MDFQHLNKTEARLQKLEQTIQQSLIQQSLKGEVALSSISIEQETLSNLLIVLLPGLNHKQYEDVSICAADAVKAAFERLREKGNATKD